MSSASAGTTATKKSIAIPRSLCGTSKSSSSHVRRVLLAATTELTAPESYWSAERKAVSEKSTMRSMPKTRHVQDDVVDRISSEVRGALKPGPARRGGSARDPPDSCGVVLVEVTAEASCCGIGRWQFSVWTSCERSL